MSNYPAAYAVDRTPGTHPIRQELANLDEAGSLYGAIIYQKAPIVMRQLEKILGPDKLQAGLGVYLKTFQFGNATWLDLIKILDERTEIDLSEWSHTWVEAAGRPSIRTEIQGERIAFIQSDPQQGRSLRWTQQMDVLLATAGATASVPLELKGERAELKTPAGLSRPELVLPTGGGLAYGDFTLDGASRAFLLRQLPELKDPVSRGAAGHIVGRDVGSTGAAVRFCGFHEGSAARRHGTNVQLVGVMPPCVLGFLSTRNGAISCHVRANIANGLDRAASSSMKPLLLGVPIHGNDTRGIAFLERIWRRQEIQG